MFLQTTWTTRTAKSILTESCEYCALSDSARLRLDCILSETVTEQLKNMPFSPSAQQQPIPGDLSDDDYGESDSDLETRITRKLLSLV